MPVLRSQVASEALVSASGLSLATLVVARISTNLLVRYHEVECEASGRREHDDEIETTQRSRNMALANDGLKGV